MTTALTGPFSGYQPIHVPPPYAPITIDNPASERDTEQWITARLPSMLAVPFDLTLLYVLRIPIWWRRDSKSPIDIATVNLPEVRGIQVVRRDGLLMVTFTGQFETTRVAQSYDPLSEATVPTASIMLHPSVSDDDAARVAAAFEHYARLMGADLADQSLF